MGWDPSMATTSCNCCGQGIEAWIDICDDCIEKAHLLKVKFDKFATKFDRLIDEGKELVEGLKEIGSGLESHQMEFYLLNRMTSFRDGNEIFEFEDVEKFLKNIIGEEEEDDE